MNITGGEKRGVRLATCTSTAVRPTAQRTRQALFNILHGGRLSPALTGTFVIDLFAGTGAIGLEALSRGAGKCVFIEQDRGALKTLQANISTLKMDDRSHILRQDARSIKSWTGPPADFIFADPPYGSTLADESLHRLLDAGAVSPQALIVVETRKTQICQPGPDFILADSRTYGIARLHFFHLSSA